MNKALICAVAFALPFAAFAEQPKVENNMLVDEHGMALYTFDNDMSGTDGKSACKGQCATNWPAAIADDYDKAGGDLSLVDAGDGKRQWAYKGHRVYRFAKDTQPGDKSGDGFGGKWHIVNP
jgi:predicted lipoprotein with Yx(FWY)xxD motif